MSQSQTKKTRRRVKAEAKKQTKKIVLETILDLEAQPWRIRLGWAWRILIAKDYFIFKKKGLIPGVEASPRIDALRFLINRGFSWSAIAGVVISSPLAVLKVIDFIRELIH